MALVAGLAVLGGVAIVWQRGPVLTWIGSLLVAEDELIHADVIVPLAGGSWDREIEAADLYGRGYAPRLVLTREPEEATRTYLEERGIHLLTSEETRLKVLVALGVPRDRIAVIEPVVTSTLDEARFVGEWAARSGARTVIVVSSPQHTARAQYIFGRYAATPRTRFIVRASRMGEFMPENWWTSRAMLRDGIFELEKLVAYRLRY